MTPMYDSTRVVLDMIDSTPYEGKRCVCILLLVVRFVYCIYITRLWIIKISSNFGQSKGYMVFLSHVLLGGTSKHAC